MLCQVCDDITLSKLLMKKGFCHHSTLSDLSESALRGCEFCALLRDRIWTVDGNISPKCVLKNGNTLSWTNGIEVWTQIKSNLNRDEILGKGPLVLRVRHADRRTPAKVREVVILLEDFYKDGVDSYRLESNFELFADFDSPYAQAFSGRPVKPNSVESFPLALTWLGRCFRDHSSCGMATPQPLPTRLIDVGSSEGVESPFLLESTGQLGNWFALSYCWGEYLPLRTTLETLEQHKQGIPLEQMPTLFQDAITITRMLQCRYLWIDALCIIQDSTDDWKREAAQMHRIYSNSTLTIVADAATDTTCGIFASADSERHNYDRTVALSYEPSDIGRNMKARIPFEPGITSTSPVGQRGWTLQEDLLSPRVLRYSAEQVFWTCQELRCCEAAPTVDDWEQDRYFRRFGTKKSFFDMNMNDTEMDIYFRFWNEIVVNNFTSRSLTKPTDTMYAIAGLAKEIERRTGSSTYMAGIWVDNLPAGLLWRACRRGERPSGKGNYIAPSWSWASLIWHKFDGEKVPSTYHLPEYPSKTVYDARILDAAISPSTMDIYGQIEHGFLRILGNWRYVDAFKEFPIPFYEDWKNTRSLWDKVSGQSDVLFPKQIICNLDETNVCGGGDEPNIFGQDNVFLQILPDALGTIYALILAPAEPFQGMKTHRRIGIAQIPKDDGMADNWEVDVFCVI